MARKSLNNIRNLSPFIKGEIDVVLDFVFKGRPVTQKLTYFKIGMPANKVSINRALTTVTSFFFDRNGMEHPFSYDAADRVVVVIPYLGSGATYSTQDKVYNRFGGYVASKFRDYDLQGLEPDTINALLDYESARRNSGNWFYDGKHIVLNKYPLILKGLSRHLKEADSQFDNEWYCLKGENRRFGLKNGKVFYYKGGNKVEMRIGKGIKKLAKIVSIGLDDNKLKDIVARVNSANASYGLQVVAEDDIETYYNQDSYARNEQIGTMAASCMRYDNCRNFFNIYKDNAKMLILVHPFTKKIKGRALLWVDKNGTKIMDRVYGSDNSYHLFFDWARDNDYVRKKWQSHSDNMNWVLPNGDVVNKTYEIEVENVEYDYYPYCDTFYYLNTNESVITNNVSGGSNYNWCTMRGLRGDVG